jgi:hypothetical protein
LGQAALDPLGHLRFDYFQDVRDVGHGPGEVVGRECPQGHGRDVEIRTPREDLFGLLCPHTIAVGQCREPHIPGVPAMAVLDQSDVPGQRLAEDLGQELAFVQPVQEPFHRASSHCRAGLGMFPMR